MPGAGLFRARGEQIGYQPVNWASETICSSGRPA
jgi:hypothetical protein